MKKLFILMFAIILLVGTISAFEIDNVKSYDEETKTITIENAFGLPIIGSKIAEVKLLSPLNNHVGLGYQKVAEFEITSFQDYSEAFKEMEFYNLKSNMDEIEISFDYRHKVFYGIEVDDFKEECDKDKLNVNGTALCSINKIGSHTEQRERWDKITPADLKENEVLTIGIFTETFEGQNVEWIPNLFGVRIDEWSEWTASLNTDLTSYYKFDGNVTDSLGANDGSDQGTANTSGIINSGRDFATTDDITLFHLPDGEFTLVNWIFPTSFTNTANPRVFAQKPAAQNKGLFTYIQDDGSMIVRAYDGTTFSAVTTSSALQLNTWNMFVMTSNSDGDLIVYFNVTSMGTNSDAGSFADDTGTVLKLGEATGGGDNYQGKMDEIGIWTRVLNITEITQLWNGGSGISFIGVFNDAPTSTLNAPADLATVFNPNVVFNATGTDDQLLQNMSLIINDTYVLTNSSPINNTLTQFPYTLASGGFWNWSVEACDNSSVCTNATFRGITFVNDLSVTLNSPIDNFETNLTSILFNTTATDDTAIVNVSLFFDGVLNETNSSGTNGTYLFTKTFTDGNYNWTLEACDAVSCSSAATRDFQVHTTPSSLNVLYPTGTIPFIKSGDNLTINWSVTEPTVNLTEHIKECLFSYNGTTRNVTDVCLTTNESSFTYVYGLDNLTMNVTEEFDLITTNSTNWMVKVFELNQTFNSETTEGNLENFEAQIVLDPSLTILGSSLFYNGTSNIGSSSLSGGITTLTVSNVLVPSVTTSTNFTFNWALALSDSSLINLTSQNQTALNLTLDNCSTFTNRIFNLTSYDEELQTQLTNTTKEIAVNIYSGDRSTLILNLSDEYVSNPTLICLNQNLTSFSNYSLDTIVRYEAIGYANEYYNIVNLELTNETEEQIISLFNLNSSDSTEFQLTFTGEDFLPVEDALVFIERQYISENTFKTVELPKTDSNGQTILHLVRNDVVYNIIVMKDKAILGTFSNLRAFCDDFSIGDCKISLNAIGEDAGLFNYDEEVGVLFNSGPIYNETTTIMSFQFVSSDGESKNVTMTVERKDVFGNTSICSNTLISTSGIVSCTVGNISDTNLETKIFIDEQEWISSNVAIDTEGYGAFGAIALFVFSLILMLALGDSNNGLIISTLIGYIAAISLGWIVGGIIGVGSAGILLIAITLTLLYLINKNKGN